MNDIKRDWSLPLTLGPADYLVEFRLLPGTLLHPQAAQSSKSSSHFERAGLPKGCQGLTPPVQRVGRSAQSLSASLLDSKHAAQWDGSGSLTTLAPSWMGGAGSSSSGSMHAGGTTAPHQSVAQGPESGPNRCSTPSVVKSDPPSALSPTTRHQLEFGNGSSASSSESQGPDALWNALLLGGGASAVLSGGSSQAGAADIYSGGNSAISSSSSSSSSVVGGSSGVGGAKVGMAQQQKLSAKDHVAASYAVGDRVLARYHASSEWRPARVARVVPVPSRLKAGVGSHGSSKGGGGGGGGSSTAATDDVWIDVVYDEGGESERALPANFLKMDPDAVAMSPGTRVLVRHRGRPQWFAAVIEGLSPVQPWIRLPPAPTAANNTGNNRVVKSRPHTPSTPAAPTSPSAPSSSSSSSSAEANAQATSPQNWEPGLFANGSSPPIESSSNSNNDNKGSIDSPQSRSGNGNGSRRGGGGSGSRGSNGSRGGGSRGGGGGSVRSAGAQSPINYGLSHGRICLAMEYDQTDDHRTHHVVSIHSGGGGTAEDALFDEASHPGHGFGEADCFVYDVRFTHTGPDFTSKRELSVPRFLIKRDPVAQEIATPSKVTLVRAAPTRTKAREALTYLKRSSSSATTLLGPETDEALLGAAGGAIGAPSTEAAEAAVAAAKAAADEEEARVKAQQIAKLAADFSEQTTSAKRGGGRPSSSSSSSSRFAGQQPPPSGGLLSLRHGTPTRTARWRTSSGEEPPSPLSPYSPVIGGGAPAAPAGASAPPPVTSAAASAAAANTAANIATYNAANTASNTAANATSKPNLSSSSFSSSSSSSFTAVGDVANWVNSPMRPPSEPRRRSQLPVSSRLRLEGGAGFEVAGITLGEYYRTPGNDAAATTTVTWQDLPPQRSSHSPQQQQQQQWQPRRPTSPLLFAGDAGGSRLHDPRNDNLSSAHDGAPASRPESAAVRNERRQPRQIEREVALANGVSDFDAPPRNSSIDNNDKNYNDDRVRTANSAIGARPVSMPALEQRLQVRAMLGSRARKPGAWRTLMPDAHGSSGRGGGSSDRQKLTVVASGDGVGVPFSPLRAQHSRPTAAAAPVLTSTRQPEEGLRLGSRRSSSSSSVENGSRSLHRVSMNALEGSGNGSSSAIARRSQRSFSSSDGNESDDQMSVDGRSFEGKPRQNSEALT